MVFIDNKYTRVYYRIVTQAKDRVNSYYTEKHHIIPKSLGGSNKKENIISLTAREHFICHRLLVKMTTGSAKIKMQRAAWAMTVHTSNRTKDRYKVTGAVYEQIRTDYVNTIKGIPKTDAHRAKLGKWKRTDAHRKAISEMRKEQTGKQNRSPATKEKMSAWQKGIQKPTFPCPHCGKEISLVNLKRWHGDNCKHK